MKKIIICFFSIMSIFLINSYCLSETGKVKSVKYIDSYIVDLNGDNEPDTVLLIEGAKGQELIVLISTSTGYNAHLLSRGKTGMNLSYHFGKEIKESTTGRGMKKEKIHKTNGVYLKLSQPESSEVAYFWEDNKFHEVWLSD